MRQGHAISVTAGACSGAADRTAILYALTDKLYRAQCANDVFEASLEAITAGMGCTRASVLLFDQAGIMRFVAWRGLSDDYRARVDGHTPWSHRQTDAEPIFVSDIDETAEDPDLKTVIAKEGIKGLAFVPLMADGGVVGKFMTYHEARRDFTQDERALALNIARQLGFGLERIKAEQLRQTAEQSLRDSEERFRAMSELAPVMMFLSDANGACLHLNRMLREFWGVSSDAVASFDWRTTMHPEDAERITATMMEAASTRTAAKVSGRYRSAGNEYRMLETEVRPRFDASGTFLGFVGANIDVTERVRAEAHRDLLLSELNHRAKNTLAVVQGIAHQTFKRSSDAAESLQVFEGRLAALARAHDLLARGTEERASLYSLASEVLVGRVSDKTRANIEGPNIDLPPRLALSVSLTLHELFTNAIKYGALSNEAGKVELSWVVEAGKVNLVWRESGGPPVIPPSRKGFGSVLLVRTMEDVGGTVELNYRSEGLQCAVTIPINK